MVGNFLRFCWNFHHCKAGNCFALIFCLEQQRLLGQWGDYCLIQLLQSIVAFCRPKISLSIFALIFMTSLWVEHGCLDSSKRLGTGFHKRGPGFKSWVVKEQNLVSDSKDSKHLGFFGYDPRDTRPKIYVSCLHWGQGNTSRSTNVCLWIFWN